MANDNAPHVPIFVGSTFEDLQPYREAVRSALHRLEAIVRGMEYFGSKPGSPVDECLAVVRSCKVYIGIFGMRYGTIPLGHSQSMTHLEYAEAKRINLPSLIYLNDDNQPVRPKFVEFGEGARRLEKLKNELRQNHVISYYTTPADLAAKVLQDLPPVLEQIGTEVVAPSDSVSAELQATIRHTLDAVPSGLREEILRSVFRPMELAAQGQIVLTSDQYYRAIEGEIDRSSAPSKVDGVVTLSSVLWTDNENQSRYIRKNVEAVRRGTNIRRLFVVPDKDWPDFYPVLREFLHGGVAVRRAKPRTLAEATGFEDMVIFVDEGRQASRAYVADPDFDDPSELRRGRLVLGEPDRARLLEAFEGVWRSAEVVTPRSLGSAPPDRSGKPEPGVAMEEWLLPWPVVSCEEAALAKAIPLVNELKSLILATSKGFIAIHLPGDAEVRLRAVKRALAAKKARLATDKELQRLGLEPGTVYAVKDPTWSLPHLVSERLLTLDMVSTNSGTNRGFLRFSPAILLEADSVMVGEFEREGRLHE